MHDWIAYNKLEGECDAYDIYTHLQSALCESHTVWRNIVVKPVNKAISVREQSMFMPLIKMIEAGMPQILQKYQQILSSDRALENGCQ